MATKRTILIAEDSIVNQKILKRILSEEYTILPAEDGAVALRLLAERGESISAIILDLVMPVMDGFAVLRAMKEEEAYQNIPVVVATGNTDDANETKALALGAWDFVSKPYNAEIIKFRLRNAIDRSQLNLLQQIRHQAEHDALTGLYNMRKFYQAVRTILNAYPQQQFVMVRLDVNRFKQFNTLYGTDAGDEFIKYIASLMPVFAQNHLECVYGHMEADVFAICTQYREKADFLNEIRQEQKLIKSYNTQFEIVTSYGLYFIDDKTLPVGEMLDRATMAAKTCKGSYLDTIAEYTEEMGKAQQLEQEVTNEMTTALEEEQFCVYFQPKYDIEKESPCGAEALVRWQHPTKGLISPGAFIPVFEKTGFIAKVDYYVWKKTCETLRKWSDAGLNPDPVSVNVSRVNLNNPNIVEIVTELVQQYGLEPRMLQLEITETAYMDSPKRMNHVVQKFHENGFTILMDDFGSGYSSLNTLKEISVDILKVDMKFLPTGENNAKSEKILASMIRMADWLGMPVVVEGVETHAQKNFLQGVGCLYVQGYYYGRPMPIERYEALISSEPKKDHEKEKVRPVHEELDAILSADPKIEAIFSSISVPVAIYEYTDQYYDRIRANKGFYDAFGYRHANNGEDVPRMQEDEQYKFTNAFAQTVTTRDSAESEMLFFLANSTAKWFRVSFRYIMSSHNGHIISAVFSDISQEKK